MAKASNKNMHLEHLEDDIVNLGYKGAQQSIAFVEALLQLFEGNATQKVNITTKWDGAPAIVAGTDPETGFFFVATKHGAFAKEMKLGFSEEFIDVYYEGGLAETLKVVYNELKDLGIPGVLQGDVMFTPAIKKTHIIDGETYIGFKPNTILYAIPKGDPLYETINEAKVGVVFHTKYIGRGPVNSLSASFGVDLGKLHKSKTAWIQDASYRDVSGKMTLTAQETRTVSSHLATAKNNATAVKNFLDELATHDKDLTVGYMFKIFVNSLVRAGTPITQRSLAGLENFIVQRISEKEKGMKTAAGKEKYVGIKTEIQKYLQKNASNIRGFFQLYESLLAIKNILVKKLNEAQSIPTFIETTQGFKHTDPEGYVAIDRKGNAVKLVNRMEFSQANFNAVKDWTKPAAAPTTVDTPLKTMVFAFGRMNPPTVGHKKLVDKVMAEATKMKGDHVVVLSRTQKAPKDPLDIDTKMKFAKLMFPNANLEAATQQLPTFIAWAKHFNGKYDKLVMIGGSDRVAEYQRILNNYNGKDYSFKVIEVISAGDRDPDADGATGISASKMRKFAEDDDFTSFKKGLPSTIRETEARKLMAAVQDGLK